MFGKSPQRGSKYLVLLVGQGYEGLSLFAVIFYFVFPGQPTQCLVNNFSPFLQNLWKLQYVYVLFLSQNGSYLSCNLSNSILHALLLSHLG